MPDGPATNRVGEHLPMANLPRVTSGRGVDLLEGVRRWRPPFLDGESLWFLAVNRNKRSVALDLTAPAGHARLHELVAHADVMLVNQPPRTLARLGIGPEHVQARWPNLVYVTLTGFGLDGERADWACYDLIAEGYSGVMDLTGAPGGGPQKVGAPAAALFARARTGKGRAVDVALVDSMIGFLSCRIVPYRGSGELPRRWRPPCPTRTDRGRHPGAAPRVGTAIRLDGSANTPRLAPPRPGGHTDVVLADWLGYSAKHVAELRRQGIV